MSPVVVSPAQPLGLPPHTAAQPSPAAGEGHGSGIYPPSHYHSNSVHPPSYYHSNSIHPLITIAIVSTLPHVTIATVSTLPLLLPSPNHSSQQQYLVPLHINCSWGKRGMYGCKWGERGVCVPWWAEVCLQQTCEGLPGPETLLCQYPPYHITIAQSRREREGVKCSNKAV